MADGESLPDRITSARAAKDLNALFSVLSEIASGASVPTLAEMYPVSRLIRELRGELGRTDTRGWKRSGKVTRDLVSTACRRALERMDMETAARSGDRQAFGVGLKRINTGEFPARIRERTRK